MERPQKKSKKTIRGFAFNQKFYSDDQTELVTSYPFYSSKYLNYSLNGSIDGNTLSVHDIVDLTLRAPSLQSFKELIGTIDPQKVFDFEEMGVQSLTQFLHKNKDFFRFNDINNTSLRHLFYFSDYKVLFQMFGQLGRVFELTVEQLRTTLSPSNLFDYCLNEHPILQTIPSTAMAQTYFQTSLSPVELEAIELYRNELLAPLFDKSEYRQKNVITNDRSRFSQEALDVLEKKEYIVVEKDMVYLTFVHQIIKQAKALIEPRKHLIRFQLENEEGHITDASQLSLSDFVTQLSSFDLKKDVFICGHPSFLGPRAPQWGSLYVFLDEFFEMKPPDFVSFKKLPKSVPLPEKINKGCQIYLYRGKTMKQSLIEICSRFNGRRHLNFYSTRPERVRHLIQEITKETQILYKGTHYRVQRIRDMMNPKRGKFVSNLWQPFHPNTIWRQVELKNGEIFYIKNEKDLQEYQNGRVLSDFFSKEKDYTCLIWNETTTQPHLQTLWQRTRKCLVLYKP